ncbi:4Fe-4S binding protein [Vulcanisaeta thermophila]|uniref:4Fe-4S binding protein n=1 Tax=Vulcanisaeta thermophila TaxID=867917 RepID=UPI00085353B4|nr:4Fe-4S binding protein [Vulcanisaeta thermophila]
MVVHEEDRLLILEDPTNEELTVVREHEGPVLIILRKVQSIDVQPNHLMQVLILRNPSDEQVELAKAQLRARRAEFARIPRESVSRRDIVMGRLVKYILKNVPTYFENACRVRYGCSMCVSACPVGAISIVGGKVVINQEACVECGACVAACPTGALAMVGADDNELTSLINKSREFTGVTRITFTCPLNGREPGANEYMYKVPCVLSVGPEWVSMALTRFNEVSLECPSSDCKLNAKPHVESLMESFTKAFRVKVINGDTLVNEELPREPPMFMGIRRSDYAKALKSLRYMATGKGNPVFKIFNVYVDTVKCSFCGVCFAKCPERAIDVGRDGDRTMLRIDPLKCIGCGHCARLCPEKAMEITKADNMPMEDQLDLVYDEVVRCRMCGKPFDTRRHIMTVKVRMGIKGDPEWLYLCPDCRRYYTAKNMLERYLKASK